MEIQDTIQSPLKVIQYLGAKDRVLEAILKNAEGLYNGGYVLDLFSGSSIVSQGFSFKGAHVIANDVQVFSQDISSALLKVGFSESVKELNIDSIIKSENRFGEFYTLFNAYVEKENEFLQEMNTCELLSLYSDFPKLWNHSIEAGDKITELYNSISKSIGKSAVGIAPLFTSLYAGTYFGIYQSLEIDELRWRIQNEFEIKNIGSWQYSFYMMCLHSSISMIVNSAGKHFAQPIKNENILNNKLLEGRLFKYRSISVKQKFVELCETNYDELVNRDISSKNKVFSKPMEAFLLDENLLKNVDLIYADPPYTAQQYSRFYHIPDILSTYIIPELQIHRGNITTGIYPENKFKSRFCSTRKAPAAFKDLFKLTKNLEANLILSYSFSKSKETGNKRMIELENLLHLASKILPDYTIEIIDVDLAYKQLNSSESINKKSEDKEVLLIVKK